MRQETVADLSTRPFTAADLDACVEIFVSTFAQPPWSEVWDRGVVRARLEQIVCTPGSFGVVIGGDGIAGFALGFSEPWHEGSHFYLKEMCIAHDRQREGIGTRLMEFLSAELAVRDTRRIYLLTARGEMSEAFYTKSGFYTSPKMILMARRFEKRRWVMNSAAAGIIVRQELLARGCGYRLNNPPNISLPTKHDTLSLLLALLLTTPAVLADETNYAQLSLPHGVRVKVPKNWWIVGKDMNATIATVQEATLEMSGVDIPKFKQTLLFRASSMPKTTYASISVTATDPDMTSDDLAQVTPEILREIDPISRDAMRKMLKAGGYELESFEPIKVVKVNGLLAMEMNYQRSGPKGPVMVRTLNLPVGDKSIVFTLSYRKAEAGLWKVTTEYMKSSIEIRK